MENNEKEDGNFWIHDDDNNGYNIEKHFPKNPQNDERGNHNCYEEKCPREYKLYLDDNCHEVIFQDIVKLPEQEIEQINKIL